MITTNTCPMLESPSTPYYDEINTGFINQKFWNLK